MCLATVLVGDDKPSQIYVRSKQKKAAEAGMQSRHVAIDGNVSQAELEDTVAALAADPGVHGILCQLPLPGGLDAEPVLAHDPGGEGRRRPDRGVDGPTRSRSDRSRRLHAARRDAAARSATSIPTAGKRAVVVGRSTLVGLPMVLLLGRKGVDATVTLAHSRTT